MSIEIRCPNCGSDGFGEISQMKRIRYMNTWFDTTEGPALTLGDDELQDMGVVSFGCVNCDFILKDEQGNVVTNQEEVYRLTVGKDKDKFNKVMGILHAIGCENKHELPFVVYAKFADLLETFTDVKLDDFDKDSFRLRLQEIITLIERERNKLYDADGDLVDIMGLLGWGAEWNEDEERYEVYQAYDGPKVFSLGKTKKED